MFNPNRLCLGCMNELEEESRICKVCGWNNQTGENKAHQLKPGTILQGKYLVGKVIGEGGFGITYVGWNILLEEKIAIKESYPHSLVARDSTIKATVIPYTGREAYVEKFKNDFLKEAKTMYRLKRVDGIVEIKDVFTENSTVYIVMEYVEGPTLKEYAKQRGKRLSMDEALKLVEPMMTALEQVHNAGLIHRDISPENIKTTPDGRAVLLDFGAARQISSEGQRSLTIEVKHGYAPFEQYQTHGKQGPWTDVYALCATIYRLITGETPPSASDRMPEDIIKRPSELGAKISLEQEEVLLKGLAIGINSRIQSIAELKEKLYKKVAGKDEKVEAVYVPAKEKTAEDSTESLKKQKGFFGSAKVYADSAEHTEANEKRIAEKERTEAIYKKAKEKMAEEKIDSIKSAAELFASIKGFEDSAELKKTCERKITEAERTEAVYKKAKAKMAEGKPESLKKAMELFASVKEFNDSAELIDRCKTRLDEIEAEYKQKIENREEKKSDSKTMLPMIIAAVVMVVIVIGVIVSISVSSMFEGMGNNSEANPENSSVSSSESSSSETDSSAEENDAENVNEDNYIKALELYNSGKYEEAKTIFESIKDYKDSASYIEAIEKEENYLAAVELFDNGDLEGAKKVFETMIGYKEADSYLENIALEEAYLEAMALYDNGKYGKAADAFNNIAGYKDSADWAVKSENERQYQNALYLYNIESYSDAKKAFEKIKNYKDSSAMIDKCNQKIAEEANSGSIGGNTGSGSGNSGNIGGNTGSGSGNSGSIGGNTGSGSGGSGTGGGNSGNSGATMSFECELCGTVSSVTIPSNAVSGSKVWGRCNGCGVYAQITVP